MKEIDNIKISVCKKYKKGLVISRKIEKSIGRIYRARLVESFSILSKSRVNKNSDSNESESYKETVYLALNRRDNNNAPDRKIGNICNDFVYLDSLPGDFEDNVKKLKKNLDKFLKLTKEIQGDLLIVQLHETGVKKLELENKEKKCQ